MTDKSNLPRYVLGGLALGAGLAIAFYCLAYLGIFMRVGVVSGSMRIFVYVLIGALALPPVIVGLHTIFWRHRNDPALNDKALRSSAAVSFVGFATLIYMAFMNGTSPALGPIIALCVVGGLCQSVLKRAPGGTDTTAILN